MEGDYNAMQNPGNEAEVEAGYYPEGYDATYADYYNEQQQGEGGNYYASYQQEGYYTQQDDGQEGTDPYQYQYNYDTNAGNYDASYEGNVFSYYTVGEDGAEQSTETPEAWSYSPEEGQQLYLDHLSTEQTAGYYYDEQGNLIDGYGGGESPTNVFNQEAYWESGQGSTNSPYAEGTTSLIEGNTEELGLTAPTTESAEVESSQKTKKKGKTARAASPSRTKTKKERIEQRQALLEKEEEETQKTEEAGETSTANINAPGIGTAATSKTSKVSKKKTRFVDRERAKFQLKLRVLKQLDAIVCRCKSASFRQYCPVLPSTRKHLTPMEKYFGSKSVECVLSDIFWASMKGDIGRVKYLVEFEGESPTDSKLDPWNVRTMLPRTLLLARAPIVHY
ncbi:hypothetical protein GQ600_20520 [Phytophthora cactorum]|nr:hypothetical protein GQ600_20520 [Phytophthora cactorum]